MMTHAHSGDIADVWTNLHAEAKILKSKEPLLADYVQSTILNETGLVPSLIRILSLKLGSPAVSVASLHTAFAGVYLKNPTIEEAVQHDVLAFLKNDPATHDCITPFLFYKGFHALEAHRFAHALWNDGHKHLALHIQNRVAELFGVDIHPAAVVGHGIMLDHATGIVIGETAHVDNDVMIWHGVTLGSRTLNAGERHPKIRRGAMLCAGCSVLGNIEVGEGARVAAGSMVLEAVPAGAVVAGVPAKIVS